METSEFFKLLRKELADSTTMHPSLRDRGIGIASMSLEFYFRLNADATRIRLKHASDLFLSGTQEPVYFRCRVKAEPSQLQEHTDAKTD